MPKINILSKILNHNGDGAGFFRYFTNTVWLFIEQFLRMMSGLLVGVWVARHLGPEQFGTFSYLITIAAICGGVAKLGMDGIIVNDLINKPELRDDYLGTAFWIRIISALGIIFLIAPIIWLTTKDIKTNIFVLITITGIIFQAFEVLELFFLSQVLAKTISICKIIQLVISSLLKIYCVLIDADLMYFVILFGFDALVFAFSIFIAYRIKYAVSFLSRFKFSIAKSLLKDSWPLLLSTVVVLIYQRLDQILIKNMLDDRSLGVYTAALKFTDSFYFIPMILTNSLATALINAKKNNVKLYRARLKRIYFLVLLISISIAVTIYFLSNILIQTFYGNEFKEAGGLLSMHAITLVLVGMGIVVTRWYIIENRPHIVFYNTLAGAMVSLIANFVLIPIYGLKGAVIASVLSHFTAAYAMNFVWQETRKDFLVLNKLSWSN